MGTGYLHVYNYFQGLKLVEIFQDIACKNVDNTTIYDIKEMHELFNFSTPCTSQARQQPPKKGGSTGGAPGKWVPLLVLGPQCKTLNPPY